MFPWRELELDGGEGGLCGDRRSHRTAHDEEQGDDEVGHVVHLWAVEMRC